MEERFCPLHPAKKRLCRRNAAVSYAADMNLLLCYYNLLDDWLDEKKPVPLALARMIRGDVREIHEKISPAGQGGTAVYEKAQGM